MNYERGPTGRLYKVLPVLMIHMIEFSCINQQHPKNIVIGRSS